MPQRIIALEIDDLELRAAVLETTFRDYRVAAVHRAPLTVAGGTTEVQVRRFVEQHSLSGDTVLSALPGDQVTWRQLFLPFRDRKRVLQTISFELENHVPFDLDEVVIDHQILHRDRAGTTVLAALVRRENLDNHLKLMQAAGLDPKVVDVAPLATLNSLRLIPNLPPSFAFLDFGSRTVTAALYHEGELRGLRTLTVTASGPASDGNGSGQEDGEADPALLARLVGEIRWTLLAMNGGPLEDSVPCYVAGERTDLDTLRPELERSLGLPIRRLDEIEMRDTRSPVGTSIPAFMSSLGLALREVSAGTTMGVNFRRGEYAYQRGQEELHRGLRGVAALAALVVALTVTDLFLDYRRQAEIVVDLDRQILAVARATLPELHDAHKPAAELEAAIEARRHELDTLNNIVPVSSSTSLDIFRAIAAAIPNNIRVDADDYLMDTDAVRVRGNADTFESIDTIRLDLLGTGFFSDVQVKDARANPKGSGVDFRLIMRLSKDVRRGKEGP
jgi:type II secretion system protein L